MPLGQVTLSHQTTQTYFYNLKLVKEKNQRKDKTINKLNIYAYIYAY